MENQLGTGYLLEVDTVTSPKTNTRGVEANYKPIVCLTSNSIDGSSAEQSTSNKCDGGYASSQPGIKSWSMSSDGQVVTLTVSEEATRENYQTLIDLWKSGEIFFMRSTDALETVYREGAVWISSYSESAPNAEAYTFTATFTGTGELFTQPA